jgi:hypothetical protein
MMAHERLMDFPALKVIVDDRRDPDDSLLPYYKGNWWVPFDSSLSCDNRNITPEGLIQYWVDQKKTLPAIHPPIPPPLLLNTGILSSQELKVAWAIAKDSLAMIDEDIADSTVGLADLTVDIVKYEAMLSDMKALHKQAMDEEMSKTVEVIKEMGIQKMDQGSLG